MGKKMIREGADFPPPPKNVDKLIAWAARAKLLAGDGAINIEISYDIYEGYLSSSISWKVCWDRPETDDEERKRLDANERARLAGIASRKAKKQALKERDRLEYARLQKKFGGNG